MELFWNLLIGVVAALPIILCVLLFLTLIHMTFSKRRHLVFALAIVCTAASVITTEASIYNVAGGTIRGDCLVVVWVRFMFTAFDNNTSYWITIILASSNFGSCILVSSQLAKPQHIGINFIVLWTTYILVILATSFHCFAIYMLVACSRVYSSHGCAIFTGFTGILAASSLYLEHYPDMPQHMPSRSSPRPLQHSPTHLPPRPLQHSPRRMLFAPFSLLKDLLNGIRGLRLFPSQEEAGDAKEESPAGEAKEESPPKHIGQY